MDNRNITKNGIILHQGLFDQIISKRNLLVSWQEFREGKKNKVDVQVFEHNLAENLISLHDDLKNKTYHHGHYISFYIHDPKLRQIHKASVRDRVLHHAIIRVIESVFENIFIFDLYSSRIGKGTHKAVLRLKEFAWKLSRNDTKTVWALKCDIRKFFHSIDHKILFDLISKKISDPDLLWLLEEVIASYPSGARFACVGANIERETAACGRGTPLGNLTSQLFSNIYLNPLDHFIKRTLKEKYYIRYADDFIVLSCNRDHLASMIPIIRSFLAEKLKLELHPDKIVLRKWNQGIDFLGYIVFPHHILLRTKTKKRMLRNIRHNCQHLR
ncbi:MAG: reverse transcriptase domain-containing protein, partial [Candidatus Berkelbacteria bacterium]|nr:reverse transcriptase domain-containing protein [Candidatus Berkelbacteria bacterium]